MYNLKRLSLLLVGRLTEESRPRVAGEQLQGSEVRHAHVPHQLVGKEVAVLLPLDQRFPVPPSRHITPFVLLRCSFKNGLLFPTILRIEFPLQNSATVNRFILEDYLTLAGQHFFQGPRLREFTLTGVFSDVSFSEFDVNFPHFYDPSKGEQQLMITIKSSALCDDIVVPFTLHQEQKSLFFFFGLELFNEEHFAFSVGSIFIQPANKISALIDNHAVIGSIISFDNQSCLIWQFRWLSFYRLLRLFLILEEQIAIGELQWLIGSGADMLVD